MTCRHHWRIEPPEGPYSVGRCIRCGEERAFRNSEWDDAYWKRSVRAHKKCITAATQETA